MPPRKPSPSALAQAAFADHVRNPSLPAPVGIAPERLAVYTRLLRNNIGSFIDLCFSDSQSFVAAAQWQAWQHRFLIEAQPESPFFNDIPVQFLHYLHTLPETEQPAAEVLAMMAFETALLHAETAMQPDTDGAWHAHSLLTWAPAARLQAHPCDFVSSGLSAIDATPCHVLSWRGRDDAVYYRIVEGIDLFLLQHFQTQDDTCDQLLHNLQALLPGQDIDSTVHAAIDAWVAAGVLLPRPAAD